MQRISLVALVAAVIGCHAQPAAENPVAVQRPLVTDQLPYQVARADVRAWHMRNGWCVRRVWPSTDEFVVCDAIHPYMNLKTPPMYSMTRYDAGNRSIAYATFTPVPCRMYGRCDSILGRTTYPAEHEFVDHWSGLYAHLADRGRATGGEPVGPPAMQQRMFKMLSAELDRRFGTPTWREPHEYGETWATTTSEIGLFVAGRGGWVVETHELRPRTLSASTP